MRQDRIVWAAMLGSQLMFMVVVGYAAPTVSPGSDATALAIAAAAIGPAILSIAWGRVIQTTAPPLTTSIIRWALAESVTLFGLVVAFLGGPLLLAAPMMAVGFLLILAQPPSGP